MIRPDAIPIVEACSSAALADDAVRALFGSGYRLRGSERVRVVATGRAEVWVPVSPAAASRMSLDALDRDALGAGPLRLSGPAGSHPAPTAELVRRHLALPAALRRLWGLEEGSTVVLIAGSVAFSVEVSDGSPPGAHLDRVDRLAAGIGSEATATLRRDLVLAPPPVAEPAASGLRPTGRLITENDIRQARLKGQRIALRAGQIITPAARSLGRELGVLFSPGT